jgi:hypothetical protein
MDAMKINQKIADRFLVRVFGWYTEENDKSYAKLQEYGFSTFADFSDYHPEMLIEKDGVVKPLILDYVKELDAQGYLYFDRETGTDYYLTEKGFNRAMELKHPIKTFCKKYYAQILTYTLGFIGVAIAMANYLSHQLM